MKKIASLVSGVLVVGLSVLGAGCSKSTEYGVRSTTPEQNTTTTVDQNQTVPGTDGWLQYKNFNYGFDFKYPASAVEIFRIDSATGTVLTLDLGPTTVSSTAVSVPSQILNVKVFSKDGSGLMAGTSLKDGCYDELGGMGQITPKVNYGGREVCVVTGADAAAGNRYDSYWYTIPLDDKYVVMSFTIHSSNCGNYENPEQCISYEDRRDSLLGKMLMSSLSFFAPNQGKQDSNMRFETVTIKENSKRNTIEVQYPEVKGGDEKAREIINNSIRDFVLIGVAEFRKLMQETVSSPGPLVMQMDYSIHHVKSGIVSIVFRGYQYTGGAHGLSTFETFIFDTSDGQSLSFEEIFKENSNYLQVISDYVTAELSKQVDADTDWIKTGASADPKNYRYYYLTQEGLVVIFPEYQVAPYAAGPSTVTVPYDVLNSIIKLEL